MQNFSISIIGAGNISWHLAKNLFVKGYKINQIYSRKIQNAEAISNLVKAEAIDSISELKNNSDLLIICVTDSAINEVVSKINFQPKLIVHTAGSLDINILQKFNNYGVFYPLQTFSKNSELDISNTPFCIEANTKENEEILKTVAHCLTNAIYELNSEQRQQCHLAAVFANNFSNHMFHIAEKLLSEKNISFDILKPLILETANKVQNTTPLLAQTGPASRNNTITINNHLELLNSSQLEKIYSFVSQNILDYKNGNLP